MVVGMKVESTVDDGLICPVIGRWWRSSSFDARVLILVPSGCSCRGPPVEWIGIPDALIFFPCSLSLGLFD